MMPVACWRWSWSALSERVLGNMAATRGWPIATVQIDRGGAPSCNWCGCQGGPGYRSRAGQCVSWRELNQTCSDRAKCNYEGNRTERGGYPPNPRPWWSRP
jgi:hypothetical protein